MRLDPQEIIGHPYDGQEPYREPTWERVAVLIVLGIVVGGAVALVLAALAAVARGAGA